MWAGPGAAHSQPLCRQAGGGASARGLNEFAQTQGPATSVLKCSKQVLSLSLLTVGLDITSIRFSFKSDFSVLKAFLPLQFVNLGKEEENGKLSSTPGDFSFFEELCTWYNDSCVIAVTLVNTLKISSS